MNTRPRNTRRRCVFPDSQEPRWASGGLRAGFSATAQIRRRDFSSSLTIPMDGGGVAVSDKVSISLEIEAVLQK